MSPPAVPNVPGEPARAPAPAPSVPPDQPLDSAALLDGKRWVEIRHNGEIYRLHATRLGKLILTK